MKYLRLYENFDDIELFCNQHYIPYNINFDGSVDVPGNVNLEFANLSKIPINFNKVDGNFTVHGNHLKSLKGCPKEVGDNFDCSNNKLTTLKYAPIVVHRGGYLCDNNELVTLEGCASKISNAFYCDHNKLKNLVGGPKITGQYHCYDNPIIELTGFPEVFGSNYADVGCPVHEITELVFVFNLQKFVNYINEHNVIQGNKIFELGLDEAYYLVTKQELTLEEKNFKNYILI